MKNRDFVRRYLFTAN